MTEQDLERPERRDRAEPSPRLHSQQRSRTRPSRRRPRLPRRRSLERRRAMLGRLTLIFGVLVGVSAIVVALLAEGDGDMPAPAIGPTAPSDAVAVQVVDIVDGDTLHVETIDGEVLTIRIFGIDTPERGEDCYGEARSRLRSLAGNEVLLLPDVRLQDRGGRELRYVFTASGASIDAALLYEGLAVAWTRDGSYRDEFITLEDEAAAANRGCLWSN